MNIINCGEIVGKLTDVVQDMWYMEGTFTPTDSAFAAKASTLNASDDYTKGIRTLIREFPDSEGVTFIVLSLSGDKLFGRCVFEESAVQWVNEHVPEI